MKFLTEQQIITMNKQQIEMYSPKESHIIVSKTALNMCIEQPKQEVFGQELYPTLEEKAGILYINLAKKHCFGNANKRTAVMALLVFLSINGKELTVTPKELEDFTVNLVVSDFDKNMVSQWIKERIN
ncbi:MAG: type II toxin-antitoxin system death-on-curing family toxin [Lactococcus cremoris]